MVLRTQSAQRLILARQFSDRMVFASAPQLPTSVFAVADLGKLLLSDFQDSLRPAYESRQPVD